MWQLLTALRRQYVYSAWAPQFADRLLLSATESNFIGLAGNLGMYSMGVPVGMLVDSRGPRSAVVIGSVLLGVGYWPLHTAYDAGHGSVPLLCFFSYLTGLGGCLAFAAAVKTSALNWPHHRGTATAFPLAAFGLSAFFFALVGSIFFPGDPSRFLELLAYGTFTMTLLGFFFLRVYPHAHSHTQYHAVQTTDSHPYDSQGLHRTASNEPKGHRTGGHTSPVEPGMSSTATTIHGGATSDHDQMPGNSEPTINPAVDIEAITPLEGMGSQGEATNELDEAASLISGSSRSSSLPGEVLVQSSIDMDRSHRVDIRGWDLLKNLEFWQLWVVMAILSGIGLMTIK